MKIIKPKTAHYEIIEKIGEGLTSEVYRAIRKDNKGWTQQPVALKIIKSKKNIQVLRQEFEKLLKVRSKYCVQMLGWESLPQGPALVLEYIEGVTLHLLHQKNLLNEDLIQEITAQMQMGLKALHRVDVFHGDLNLKNVLITNEGVVKLIDMGFFSTEKGRMATTYFMQTETMNQAPSRDSDYYSLGKIYDYLHESQHLAIEPIDHQQILSKASRRRSLAKVVSFAEKSEKKSTVAFTQALPKSRWKHRVPLLLLSFAIFFSCLMQPLLAAKNPEFGEFQVRSHQWIQYSLNGLPDQYGPVVGKKLRVGNYRLQWRTPQGEKQGDLEIQQNQTFLLQPEAKLL